MRTLARAVNIRTLFAILVAVAVLFAPAVSRASDPLARALDHEQMMQQTGHCQMPSGSADHEKSAGKSCCIWNCVAVAHDAATPSDEAFLEHLSPTPTIPTLHIGYLGEIATPPPRRT